MSALYKTLSFLAVLLVIFEFKLGFKLNWANWTFMPRDRIMLKSIFMLFYTVAVIDELLTVTAPEPLMLSVAVGAINRLLKKDF
jgi:hypothetical protein